MIRATFTALFLFLPLTLLPSQVLFGAPAVPRLPQQQDNTYAVALGDVDRDGDLDLVCANMGAPQGQNKLYCNDGRGGFHDATSSRFPAAGDSTMALALGDVDGDGDLDLVWANYAYPTGQNSLWLNNGKGYYKDTTSTRMPRAGDLTYAVALGDVDGDGDPDLLFGNAANQNRLYLNDGKGTFTDHTAGRMPADQDVTNALVLADLDGDGDPDLVCANSRQNRLYLNDGKGFFTDATSRLPGDSDETTCLGLGDLDGDGDPDLVCGTAGLLAGQRNRLYLNDGKGFFTDATTARTPFGPGMTRSLVLGDLDGDGDLDLVCGNQDRNRLYLNDGRGRFTDATAILPKDEDITYGLALGDLDGDDDPDLVYGNTNVPFIPKNKLNRVLLNLTRQIEGPEPPVTGRTWLLDLHARSARGTTLQLVIPCFAAGQKRTRVPPFGTFGLDWDLTVVLGAVFVGPPLGRVRLPFAIPPEPTLVDRDFFVQGLHVTDLHLSALNWRFTNLLRERIRKE